MSSTPNAASGSNLNLGAGMVPTQPASSLLATISATRPAPGATVDAYVAWWMSLNTCLNSAAARSLRRSALSSKHTYDLPLSSTDFATRSARPERAGPRNSGLKNRAISASAVPPIGSCGSRRSTNLTSRPGSSASSSDEIRRRNSLFPSPGGATTSQNLVPAGPLRSCRICSISSRRSTNSDPAHSARLGPGQGTADHGGSASAVFASGHAEAVSDPATSAVARPSPAVIRGRPVSPTTHRGRSAHTRYNV